MEKRISSYRLERLFSKEYSVLDIGSNFGFFVCEFAIHCKLVHGIEPNKYLNKIGFETAEFLKVDNKVKFFNCYFDKFKSDIKYDVILSLASFFTQDKREKGDADYYFGSIDNYLNYKGYVFYESTSYTKNEGDRHCKAKNEAKGAMHKKFDIVEEYETNSGSEGFFRYFILAKKRV